MTNELITSWFSVVFFTILGLYILCKRIGDKTGTLSGKMSDYAGGLGMIIFAIALAIAKILGKV